MQLYFDLSVFVILESWLIQICNTKRCLTEAILVFKPDSTKIVFVI